MPTRNLSSRNNASFNISIFVSIVSRLIPIITSMMIRMLVRWIISKRASMLRSIPNERSGFHGSAAFPTLTIPCEIYPREMLRPCISFGYPLQGSITPSHGFNDFQWSVVLNAIRGSLPRVLGDSWSSQVSRVVPEDPESLQRDWKKPSVRHLGIIKWSYENLIGSASEEMSDSRENLIRIEWESKSHKNLIRIS